MQKENNPLKGFAIGIASGVVGLLAMKYYWKYAAPKIEKLEKTDENKHQINKEASFSLVGKQFNKEESSTDALGRIAYTKATGENPSDDTESKLSNIVHWLYGLTQAGIFGVLKNNSEKSFIRDGLLFATALWLFGDEIAVPMLGLQSGPESSNTVQHANRLGAHLTYGISTAFTDKILTNTFKN